MKKVAHDFFEDDGLDYEDMLNDFDNFCDQFEDRASKAYLKGDQNDGRVVSEIERVGENTPMAVREVEHPRGNLEEIGKPIIDV